jgi:hypothetical protein
MCLCQQNLDELRIVDAGQLWGKGFGTCPTLSVFIAEFDQLRKILPVIGLIIVLNCVDAFHPSLHALRLGDVFQKMEREGWI